MRASIIGFLLILGVGIVVAYNMISGSRQLPILNPSDINPELVDKEVQGIRSNHRIEEFSLVDQNGGQFNSGHTEGKIYVADFFFTTCPSICPKMTKQMYRVQDVF